MTRIRHSAWTARKLLSLLLKRALQKPDKSMAAPLAGLRPLQSTISSASSAALFIDTKKEVSFLIIPLFPAGSDTRLEYYMPNDEVSSYPHLLTQTATKYLHSKSEADSVRNFEISSAWMWLILYFRSATRHCLAAFGRQPEHSSYR